MIRKYHNHKMQTKPWYREKEPHYTHKTPGRQAKQSNQLTLRSIAKLEWTQSSAQQNI